ncbi:hypothetical protein [Carboxydothermus ferrireducens]|uniref:NitT/TauT family transport system substrate-binding protein n=1 Tax=Carboxydothermus ferrireducens DSM 11255 TaxID=1119529 RepID=A0ABX2R7X4_9THEO|nr:hypothetical protein [Carboxydothermus ferrireducens]NYE57276.1 hypothetical protein [Carboxydothermus ferrireducens DSM 11255]
MKKIIGSILLLVCLIFGIFLTLKLNKQTIYGLFLPKNSPHFWLLYYLTDKGYWELYGTKVKVVDNLDQAALIAVKASEKIPAGYKILIKLSNFEPYSIYLRNPAQNFSFKNKAIILPPRGSKQYRDVVDFLSRQGIKPYKDYTPYFDLPEEIKEEAFMAGIGNLYIASTLTPLKKLTPFAVIKAPDLAVLAVKDDIKFKDLQNIISALYHGQKAFYQNPEATAFLSLAPVTQQKLFLFLNNEGFFSKNLSFNPATVAIAQQYYNNPQGPFFQSSFYTKLLQQIREKVSFTDLLLFVFQKIFS